MSSSDVGLRGRPGDEGGESNPRRVASRDMSLLEQGIGDGGLDSSRIAGGGGLEVKEC